MLKADCGHDVVSDGIGTGYATDAKTQHTMCYACADSAQATEMGTADKFTAYLSSDGRNITTWSGGVLARVTSETSAKIGWHDSEVTFIRAKDVDNNHWYGRNGGRGMCVTLRRKVAS